MNKIDMSLKERKEIIKYLKKVEQKGKLTLKELRGIGDKLSRMSKLKVQIILRNFDLTNSKTLLKRYSFLMGYLKDESFIDPLLERYFKEEKNENYKSAILSILRSYDIDISGLLINDVLDSDNNSFESLSLEILNEAEKNEQILIYFVDEMFFLDDEQKGLVLREFLRVGGVKALKLLGVVAESGDEVMEKMAVEMLGKFRDKSSANILSNIKRFALKDEIRALAGKNLRRLAFLMIQPDEAPFSLVDGFESFTAYLGGIDGTGNRGLWMYMKSRDLKGFNINLLLNEEWGIVDCYYMDDVPASEFDKMVRKIRREEPLASVPFDYAMSMVRDAINLNLAKGIPFPPEFIIGKRYFNGLLNDCKEHIPSFENLNLEDIKKDRSFLHTSGLIFELPEFKDWVILNSLIFDYAEMYRNFKNNKFAGKESRSLLVKKVYESIIADKVELLRRRLFLEAEYYLKFFERKKNLSKILLSAGLNLSDVEDFLCSTNPFIRGLIINSLENACQTMNEKNRLGEAGND